MIVVLHCTVRQSAGGPWEYPKLSIEWPVLLPVPVVGDYIDVGGDSPWRVESRIIQPTPIGIVDLWVPDQLALAPETAAEYVARIMPGWTIDA